MAERGEIVYAQQYLKEVPEGTESANFFYERLDRFLRILDSSTFTHPNDPDRILWARIGVVSSFTQLVDLGEGKFALDSVGWVLDGRSQADKERKMDTLKNAVRLREGIVLVDGNETAREVLDKSYWPKVRMVFGIPNHTVDYK